MKAPICTPKYGETNPSPEDQASASVKRFGSVIGLNADREQYYRELHANAWPSVIARLRKSNIRNYSAYVTEIENKKYLFGYFEYTGANFEADMREIALDPDTQRWWQETDPCQFQLPSRKPDANWSDMEMLFLME